MENERKEAVENTISVLEWDAASAKSREIRVPAVGDVPAEVWEALNRAFKKRQAKGWFEAASPAEAYNFVAERVLKKAAERQEVQGVARRVYLLGVMYNSLREFGSREIASARQNAYALANWERAMIKRYGLEDEEVTVASLLELLPYEERPSDTHAEARRTLNELMPHLPREVREAFRAFVVTDGDFRTMARRLRVPLRTLYRRWKRYLALARQIAVAAGPPKKR